jgi:hypothetical protein
MFMRIVLMFLSVLFFNSVFSQVSSVEMRGDFADAARLGRLQGGESLPTFSSNHVKGTRYLTESWSAGSIVPFKGNTIDSLYIMFDKQNSDIYVKSKNASQIILVDKNQVKSFVVNDRFFISGSQLEGGDPTFFYEKLAGKDKGISLYKIINTKFIKADMHDAERIKNGDFDDEYRDGSDYYIKYQGQPLQSMKLTEKSLSKTLPGESKKIRSYFDDHYNDEINEKYFLGLIDFLNK